MKDGLGNYCRICMIAYQQGNLDLARERREQAKSSATYPHKGVIPVFDHIGDRCDCPGKWCPGCEQVKCYGAFGSLKKSKSGGLRSYCRVCEDAMSKARYWNNLEHERTRRSEEKREYARTWRRDNPEYMKKYSKAYQQAHPEDMREYYEKNADKGRERARAYAQSHPTERAINEQKRRARKLQVGGVFTRQEWEALCEYYDYSCLRCGRRVPEIKLTVDHVIPLSQGGSNSIDNIQPLCHSCNMSKHARTIDYRIGWESRH